LRTNSEQVLFFIGPTQMLQVLRSRKIAAHTLPSLSGGKLCVRSKLAERPPGGFGSPVSTTLCLTAVLRVDASADAAVWNRSRWRDLNLATPSAVSDSMRRT
jgi:hypothetical protein